MTEQEAIHQAWAIAENELENAQIFYEIDGDRAYDIEPLASDCKAVKTAIDRLIESLMNGGSIDRAVIDLQEEIYEAISELDYQWHVNEEYMMTGGIPW